VEVCLPALVEVCLPALVAAYLPVLVAAYLPALVEVCLPALAGGARLVQGLTTINGIDQIQTANEASY
jgi:hypothetical protein